MSTSAEETGEQSKKLWNASELERKRSKRKDEDNSPGRPREEPDEARGEAVASGGVQSHLERTRTMENERVVETNALRRDTRSGRHAVELEASRVAEGDWDSTNVAKGADHDGICPRSDGNERVVETNASCRGNCPGGHLSEPEASKGVEGDWKRQIDIPGVAYDRERGEMGGATSGARRDSKRVETDPLATEKEGQHERRKRTTSDVPRPSTPLPIHPRGPTEPVNPPRRRGKLKRSLEGSDDRNGEDRLTDSYGHVEAKADASSAADMSYTARRWCRRDTEARYTKTRSLEPIEDGPRTLGQHDH